MLHESSHLEGHSAARVSHPAEPGGPNEMGAQPAPGSGIEGRRRCALCGREYLVTDSRLLPFCSSRCQQVDLGKWLGEAYGLPWEDPAGGESPPGDQAED